METFKPKPYYSTQEVKEALALQFSNRTTRQESICNAYIYLIAMHGENADISHRDIADLLNNAIK